MKNLLILKHRRSLFTLIEMLVVVSIIGILASLLMPAMQEALNQSRQTSCLNNLRQLGISTTQYINDNSGFFPAARVGTYYWSNHLIDKGYAVESQMFMCPSFGTRVYKNNSTASYSYGMCRDLSRTKLSEASMPSQNLFKRYGKGPSTTWFFGDSVGYGWWTKLNQCYMISWNTGTYFNSHFRHGLNNGNFWFLDGHANSINLYDADNKNVLFPYFLRAYDIEGNAVTF